MKKLRTCICLCVIALCLPGIVISARRLPADRSPLIEKKYAGWSGVLRIRAFEGWTGGETASAWIRRCAPAFEKAHPGVYIEITSADPDRLTDADGVRAPDMILFPPGLLSSVSGLAPVGELPVRSALMGCGQGYAAPVALGGYGWAMNPSASGQAAPPDEEWRIWSNAGGPVIEENTEAAPQGVDLGLPASAAASDPLDRFINGRLGAVCVTQREIARLNRLADQGRGPEWTFAPADAWTDQALYLSALSSGGEREQLSLEFMRHLLSYECQRLLVQAGLFTVLDAPTGYAYGGAMAQLDAALLRPELKTPPAFNINPEP